MAARLADVPMNLGEWRGRSLELGAPEVAAAGIEGYLYRQYVHQGTGQALKVLIVCGRPRLVSGHTPDICYAGAGYSQQAEAVKFPVTTAQLDRPAAFWRASFRKEQAALPDPLRIYWAWAANGSWQAADEPAATFARYPGLYKLYVVYSLSSLSEPEDQDPAPRFLGLLLPGLQRTLFPAA